MGPVYALSNDDLDIICPFRRVPEMMGRLSGGADGVEDHAGPVLAPCPTVWFDWYWPVY